ncbi:lipolytic protein G-D-S-L family [Alicyclobacillus hesperidum URH17-3-68]|uniref:hypothetical protein n=1 Tax=Alicyclobacillus hesperidum TaxID=89784 RepID=UPI000281BB4B|nr:hypothetical protein [Alicyclobacillus hesperidum]EJY56453.1 lipolytic protein G-D-S-L family [Alicyclobacillus hesperidum URH17-3-68]
MCGLANRLLAEKLIDDFYESRVEETKDGEGQSDTLTEELKSLLPTDAHALLFRWEAQCAETCEKELRRFALFVADAMLMEFSRVESHLPKSACEG